MHDPERENGTGPWDGSRPEVLGGPGEERPGRRPPAQMWRRGSRRGRAVVAATTVAVLAVGGTAAYAATSDGSGTPSATASSSSSPDTDRKHDHRDGRFGRGGPGVHGEATVKDPDSGDWVVRTWQRGTVEKVDGDQVTVRSDDDTSWTWTVDEDSAVHRFTGSDPDSDDDASDGSGPGSLQKDDKVVVVGTRTGDDTRTASHVIAGGPGRPRGPAAPLQGRPEGRFGPPQGGPARAARRRPALPRPARPGRRPVGRPHAADPERKRNGHLRPHDAPRPDHGGGVVDRRSDSFAAFAPFIPFVPTIT
ncbi:hypothetical protein GCM10020256_70600 [Streptomyces thermocoprophilus]